MFSCTSTLTLIYWNYFHFPGDPRRVSRRHQNRSKRVYKDVRIGDSNFHQSSTRMYPDQHFMRRKTGALHFLSAIWFLRNGDTDKQFTLYIPVTCNCPTRMAGFQKACCEGQQQHTLSKHKPCHSNRQFLRPSNGNCELDKPIQGSTLAETTSTNSTTFRYWTYWEQYTLHSERRLGWDKILSTGRSLLVLQSTFVQWDEGQWDYSDVCTLPAKGWYECLELRHQVVERMMFNSCQLHKSLRLKPDQCRWAWT